MEAPQTRTSTLRRDLRRVYADAVAFSVMVGVGETYLAAFVLALGMSELTAGLIASVPLLAGGVIQLVSPAAVRQLRSHRRWVVLCALAQAASFFPLIYAAIGGRIAEWALFVMAALYWGSGMATGPAWNTWVGTLIPRAIRPHYFAGRSRAAHVAVLIGLVSGGLLLQGGAATDHTLTAFAVLFAIASLCRFISAALLAGQSEPQPPDERHRMVPMRDLIRRFRRGHDGRLLLYMLATQAAVQISGPYFTPYMLRDIEMSYLQYLVLIATSYSARIIAMPLLGAWVRGAGAQRVLWFAGLGIVPLSALWLLSDSMAYLFAVQLVAGTVWAAYELATFLLLFDTIREEERTSVLTTYNLVHAVATVGGASLGGWMLTALGSDTGAYMTIFAVSGGVRLLTIALLARAVKVMPAAVVPAIVEPMPLPTRIVAVRPNLGSIERPILPAFQRLVTRVSDHTGDDRAAAGTPRERHTG